MLRILLIIGFLTLVVLVAFFAGKWLLESRMMSKSSNPNKAINQGQTDITVANPASVYCQKSGGKSELRSLPGGGQYGVCVFGNGNICEEWALYNGECPVGGLLVSGYRDEAQVYCAITGGRVMESKGACSFLDGSSCSAKLYFEGSCKRVNSK